MWGPRNAYVPVVAPDEPTMPTFAAAAPAAAQPIRRESLHVRLPAETVDRVREAAHRLKRERQDIADEALREGCPPETFSQLPVYVAIQLPGYL
jgi:hypothetical protein